MEELPADGGIQEDSPMLTGAHVIVNSADAEADRAFFRDVLGIPLAPGMPGAAGSP
jgi:hypothetical protein